MKYLEAVSAHRQSSSLSFLLLIIPSPLIHRHVDVFKETFSLAIFWQEDFIKKSDSWCRELELMIKTKKKAEIQSLSAFGFQYLTHTYLPQKLQNGDWV